MDRNSIFSGQLFLRDRGPAISLDMTTRVLYGVCGIIAMPKDVELKGEHQYPIVGFDSPVGGIILTVGYGGVDLTQQARGQSIGGLLTQPIWKI